MSSAFNKGHKRRLIAKKNPCNTLNMISFFQLQRLQSRICDLLTVDSPSNRKKIDVCVAVSQIEIENMNFSRNNRRLKSASSLNSRLKIGRTFLIISRTLAISTALVVFPFFLFSIRYY